MPCEGPWIRSDNRATLSTGDVEARNAVSNRSIFISWPRAIIWQCFNFRNMQFVGVRSMTSGPFICGKQINELPRRTENHASISPIALE